MGWAAAAVFAYTALSGLMSNKEQANQNSDMAKWRRYYGQINAANVWRAADSYAKMKESFSQYSGVLTYMTGAFEANSILSRAAYNMQIVDDTSEYNAQLYENEAQEIWDQLELDEYWLRMERSAERADITVSYAHAGVELNSTDTPAQVLLDSRTQEELEVLILTEAADREASKLLDAAAMSRWEGRVTQQQMLYEASVESYTTMLNAYGSMSSMVLQGFMDAEMTRFNGANQADALLYEAYYGAASYDAKSDYYSSAWTNIGTLVGAASTAMGFIE